MIKANRFIFFTKFPPPYTGMTVLSQTFASLLDHSADVYCINTSNGKISPDEIGLEWLKYHAVFSVQLAGLYTKLWRRLRDTEYDVFYTVASPSVLGHWRNRVALEIARPHVSRVVAHIHNGNFPQVFEMSATKKSAQRMKALVDTFVFSNSLLSEQAAEYLPTTQRRVVHNTIDETVRCTNEEVEGKIADRSQERPLQVLYLSNMIKTKGYEDVAEAVSEFNSSTSNQARVDFIGDWPSTEAREQFENRWNVYSDSAIRVHGRVTDRSVIRQSMLDADVFVLPTYYPNEAQPVSIIEALNAGTPVIATEHASIPRYVFDDENGYLVRKRSPSDIVESLCALSDYDNWKRKARAARSTYEDLFSPEAVRRQLLGVFRRDASDGVSSTHR
jgi:glycosyltransferase involved in cell wall biosynthesis